MRFQLVRDCESCLLGHASKPGPCAYTRVHRPQGALLYQQGDALGGLMFLKTGLVALAASDAGGTERYCSLRGPGGVLGWEGLRGMPAQVQAFALTDVDVCQLAIPRAVEWMASRGDRGRALLDLALEEIQRQCDDKWLLSGTATSRLARFLLERHRAGLGNHPLEVERRLLARVLGVRAETLSRCEKELRLAELVSEGRGLFIRDFEGLRQVAEGAMRPTGGAVAPASRH